MPRILLNMAVGHYMDRECEQIISSYVQRVSDAGAVPFLIPSLEKEKNIDSLLDIADAVVLIGGKDTSTVIDGESLLRESELYKLGVLKLIDCAVLENSYVRLRYKVIS